MAECMCLAGSRGTPDEGEIALGCQLHCGHLAWVQAGVIRNEGTALATRRNLTEEPQRAVGEMVRRTGQQCQSLLQPFVEKPRIHYERVIPVEPDFTLSCYDDLRGIDRGNSRQYFAAVMPDRAVESWYESLIRSHARARGF